MQPFPDLGLGPGAQGPGLRVEDFDFSCQGRTTLEYVGGCQNCGPRCHMIIGTQRGTLIFDNHPCLAIDFERTLLVDSSLKLGDRRQSG